MDWYDNLRSWFQGWFGPAATPVQVALPAIASPRAANTLGTAPEGGRRTCTGAKCYKPKKTQRRRN